MDMSLGDTRQIIDACKARGVLRNQAAYVLATAYHESAHLVRPIYERGARDYFNKYEPGTRIGDMLGNVNAGDGYLYRGRGYVQLTGRANYAKASAKLGLDLVHLPDLALVPANAAQILVVGMLEGWFTGKKLSDYITLSSSDFVNGRRIINGTDRADLIAGYAKEYDALLKAEGYEAGPRPSQPASPTPVPASTEPSAPAKTPAAPVPLKPVAKHVGTGLGAIGLVAALITYWHDLIAWIHTWF